MTDRAPALGVSDGDKPRVRCLTALSTGLASMTDRASDFVKGMARVFSQNSVQSGMDIGAMAAHAPFRRVISHERAFGGGGGKSAIAKNKHQRESQYDAHYDGFSHDALFYMSAGFCVHRR